MYGSTGVAAPLLEVLGSKPPNTPHSNLARPPESDWFGPWLHRLPTWDVCPDILLRCFSRYWRKIAEYSRCPLCGRSDQIGSVGQGHTHLATWISVDVKRRLSAVAARQGISESALLRRLVEQVLASSGLESSVAPTAPADTRGSRLTIRLVPEDSLLLRERAGARSIPAATYVSILVRSHLRALAPLPKEELAELRQSITELKLVGRSLNQIARVLNHDARAAPPGRQEVQAMMRVAEALRDHFRALLKANVESWQTGHAETTH